MTTTKLYLDIRSKNANGECPLKITITKHGKAAQYSLGVRLLPSQWDSVKLRVKDHPNKQRLNNFIQTRKNQFDNLLLELTAKGELAQQTSTQIKNKISQLLSPDNVDKTLFIYRFREYMSRLNTYSTREKYTQTLNRILQFDPKAEILSFEDITKDWLSSFEQFLKPYNPSRNGRNIHFRNIRAVFNDAIDNNITQFYPFRKFKIRPETTAKRSLSVEDLRTLFNYPCEPFQKKYVDIFKLTFFLIGINLIDLCSLKGISNGYITYNRAKTGRLYNIKVEPEALAIINKYRGNDYLLQFSEELTSYKNLTKKIDKELKRIGPVSMIPNPKKGKHKHELIKNRNGLFPKISLYWARHTWATIAAELDIPKETIAAALGHGGYTVTDTYISFDSNKIDEANRKVIDYVLYNK